MITHLALTAHNGNYVIAAGDKGQELSAVSDGIGAWETFRLFNQTQPNEVPRHGDQVALQTWTGRFIAAVDGGGSAVNAEPFWIDTSSIFVIEKVGSDGEVHSIDQIRLQTTNHHYIDIAAEESGNVVQATSTRRSASGIFTVNIFDPQLIRLRSSNGCYVTAEGGGGGQMTANRAVIGLWETFSIINLSRSGRHIQNGDIIALQVWNGEFMQSSGRLGINTKANRATQTALFMIRSLGADIVGHGQQISLQSLSTLGFVATRSGIIVLDRPVQTAEASFTIEFAEAAGIDYRWLPDGETLSDRPFETFPAPVSGTRELVTLFYHNARAPQITASTDQVSNAIFGRSPSLASWLQTMSGGVFGVSDAGVFGSIRIPDGPSNDNPDPGMSAILTAAENEHVPLASFSSGHEFDTSRFTLVEISAWALGGQNRLREGTSRRRIHFSGNVPWVGVTPDINERSQMVLCHELSHALMDVADRYGVRVPLKGDVNARSEYVADWEVFTVVRVGTETRTIRSGDRIMLRSNAWSDKYFSVDPNSPNFINLETEEAGDSRIFTITNTSGTGEIICPGEVTFRSHTGHYMTAELGGNSAVTANRSVAAGWEKFSIWS